MPEDTRPNMFPAFKYQDAPAAIDWLERAFGFTRQGVHQETWTARSPMPSCSLGPA